MQMKVVCSLEHDKISKDYRRLVLSLIKTGLEKTNPSLLDSQFSTNQQKRYTWSVFMKNAQFQETTIQLKDKFLIINWSTSDSELAVNYYNAFSSLLEQDHRFGTNMLTVEQVEIVPQQIIRTTEARFKTESGIVVRDHRLTKYDSKVSEKDNGTDWFYSIRQDQNKFNEILKRNMLIKYREYLLVETLAQDINELEFEPEKMKVTVAKNYDKSIEVSLGTFTLKGKAYLLNEIYQSGLGSLTGLGFGKLTVIA